MASWTVLNTFDLHFFNKESILVFLKIFFNCKVRLKRMNSEWNELFLILDIPSPILLALNLSFSVITFVAADSTKVES